ncbi:MAG: hypothetical protein IJR96_01060 [Pseudobutyrivibrio sp.]|nr:hypothetical protein [Pseudobutyrivibrio sp.]
MKLKAAIGNLFAFVSVILFLAFIGNAIVPQLIDSVKTFAYNFDGYVDGLQTTLM